MKWIVPFAIVGSVSVAGAAPCDREDGAVARRAAAELALHSKLSVYCAPCGDKAPGEPKSYRPADIGTWWGNVPEDGQVAVFGARVDILSTYVATSVDHYANLGALLGCPIGDIAPSLRVFGETGTGVMIVADTTPVHATELEPPAPPPPPAAPIVAAAPAPSSIYVINSSSGVGWTAIVLGCGATSALWALGMVAGRRRRRRMTPRAIDLRDR